MGNKNLSSESAYIQLSGNPFEKKKSVKSVEVVASINSLKDSLKSQILTKECSWGFEQITHSIESMAWNFDESLLAVADWGSSLFICEVRQKENLENLKLIKRIDQFQNGELSWHPTENLIAFLGKNNKINIFDLAKNFDEITQISHTEEITIKHLYIKWHPKNKLIAFSVNKNQICISDLEKTLRTIEFNFDCLGLNWNNAGDKIAYSGNNNLIIWDYVENNQYLKITENEKSQINCINWSKDDEKICYLSSSGTDKKIKIWDVDEEIEEKVFGSVHYDIVSIDWNSDGRFIAAINKDNSMTILDIRNSFEIITIKAESNELCSSSVKWNHSCTRIVSQIKSQITIYSWSTENNCEPIKKSFEEKACKSILSPDGNKLLICFQSNKIQIFDLLYTQAEFEETLDSDLIDAIWDKSSKKIICLMEENIYLYDFVQKKSKNHLYENDNGIRLVRYNNDCTWIAGAGNKIIEIIHIDLENFHVEFEIEAHERNISDVRWIQDGTKLLTASRDKTIKLWNLDFNLKKGELILQIKKHSGFVYCALWSESEKHIISIGADQYIRIFDSENGKELYSINTQDETKKDLNWFSVYNQNFLIYLKKSENSLQLINIKTGLHLKTLNFRLKGSKKNIIMENLSSSNEKIVLCSDKDVLIYDNKEIWSNFEAYQYLFFLLDYLPKKKIIEIENAEIIEKIVNYFYFDKAPSAFHILSNFKLEEEFEILIRFCMKHKIYPRIFYDDPNYSLLKILNFNKTNASLMDLFFDFVIESDVALGNLFYFDCEELLEYTKQNSLKVCNFFNSRFKSINIDNCNIEKWNDDEINYYSTLTSNFDNIKNGLLKFKEVDIVNISCDEKNNEKENEFESVEKPNFKVLDIPFEKLGLEFISKISKTNSFDDFCKSHVIISVLDILWENGVRYDFIMTNVTYFLYFIVLIANSLVVLPVFLTEIESNPIYNRDSYWIAFLILNLVLIILLVWIVYVEISEFLRNKHDYFRSFWNKLDWINIVFSIACIIFNIVILFDGTDEYGWLRVFHSICFFSSMVRIFDFFRVFKQTCFLIETVLEVIYDMRFFIFVMTLFVSTFSFSSKLIFKKNQKIF